MPIGIESACVAASYGAGCLPTGWLLVRSLTGRDVRAVGSGSTGARNVGRVLGPSGFAATMMIDIAKGSFAVGGSRLAGCGKTAVAVAAVAVVAGHVWPAPLGLRGGKGVATAFGATLALDLVGVSGLITAFVIAWALFRRATPAAMTAFSAAPFLAWTVGLPKAIPWSMAAVAAVVVFAHRENLRRELFGGRSAEQEAGTGARNPGGAGDSGASNANEGRRTAEAGPNPAREDGRHDP